MELSGGASGGVMLALAAGLWLVYLIPSWLRSREYNATERNAVRLQQTLRVLAETAEVPVAVRAETTARSVAEQQRTLRQAQQLAAREARAVEAVHRARDAAALRKQERLAAAQPAITGILAARNLAAMRLRRTRAVTALVLLGSLVALLVQVLLMALTGIAAGAWLVVAFSAVGVVSSFSLLGRLAAVSRSRAALVAARVPLRRTMSPAQVIEPVEMIPSWTPVPIPKPLYLTRSVMEQVVVEADIAAAELQAASAAAAERLRAAERALPTIAPAPVEEPRRLTALNIDEVLRRRRAAG